MVVVVAGTVVVVVGAMVVLVPPSQGLHPAAIPMQQSGVLYSRGVGAKLMTRPGTRIAPTQNRANKKPIKACIFFSFPAFL